MSTVGNVSGMERKDESIKHYSSSHKILLAGEGDFSFSLCLAQAFGSATNMVATSLDSEDFLFGHYKQALSNILELEIRGCRVLHCIDATNMAQHDKLRYQNFDRIIFNFPHADFIPNDSRANQLMRHQKLVRSFFENARRMLEVNGEVHVTHKSNGFHSQWNLAELASESCLRLIEEVDFKLEDYPGYSNKYGYVDLKTDLSFIYTPYSIFGNYKKALTNISELQTRGCRVMHCIDATDMAQHEKLRYRQFDRIIFNFPHAEFIPGDSRANQLMRHQKLVRSFFENARKMLEVDGEIHVTHKSNGFHFQWNLKELASQSDLRLIEKVNFKLEDYPGYNNKYGFGNFKRDLSFSYRPSMTYKFGHDHDLLLLTSFPVCMNAEW